MKENEADESTTDMERWAEPVYLDASALVKLFVPEVESGDGLRSRPPNSRAAAHAG